MREGALLTVAGDWVEDEHRARKAWNSVQEAIGGGHEARPLGIVLSDRGRPGGSGLGCIVIIEDITHCTAFTAAEQNERERERERERENAAGG
jgi:hypothetical protein